MGTVRKAGRFNYFRTQTRHQIQRATAAEADSSSAGVCLQE